MDLFVGTSGYSYPEWKGSFYPPKLPAKQMLPFYGTQFRAVESIATSRKTPTVEVVQSWADAVPAGFRFALKAPQRITHFRRLKDCKEPLAEFLAVAKTLKKRLGPILFQLPPNFKKDVPRLAAFLKLLPKGVKAAFEFRHQSWFDDETFDLLRQRKVALCLAEAEADLSIPFVATADWGYLRLRLPSYDDAALKAWAKRVTDQTWREAYVFFMHDDAGNGPKFAKRFAELAAG